VLLMDRSNRSLALLNTLTNGGSSASAPYIQKTIAELGRGVEFKSVNVFLLPSISGTNVALISTSTDALNHYDAPAAGTIRSKYCVHQDSQHNSICHTPYNRGPIMLVFLEPISGIPYEAKLPGALAVDLSAAPEAEFPRIIDVIESAMNVPHGYSWGDRLMPLSFVDTVVATFFDNTNKELEIIPGVKAFFDHVIGGGS
jgi:hypothetical protein